LVSQLIENSNFNTVKMKKIVIITALFIGLVNCTKNKAEPIVEILAPGEVDPNCPDTILFSTQVMNDVFVANCNGCHGSGGSAVSFGEFTNHSNISDDATKILQTLKHESGVTAMPIGGNALNDSLITAFDCWIKQGKLNN
jgi:hypothetical protein